MVSQNLIRLYPSRFFFFTFRLPLTKTAEIQNSDIQLDFNPRISFGNSTNL